MAHVLLIVILRILKEVTVNLLFGKNTTSETQDSCISVANESLPELFVLLDKSIKNYRSSYKHGACYSLLAEERDRLRAHLRAIQADLRTKNGF